MKLGDKWVLKWSYHDHVINRENWNIIYIPYITQIAVKKQYKDLGGTKYILSGKDSCVMA